jgi:O-antigen/teichoic acid export membrane protein
MNKVKNFIWMSSERILLLVNGLVFSVLLANTMEKSEFGMYMYIQMFASLFSIFISLGLDSVLIRQLVANESSFSKYISNIIIVRAIVFVLIIIFIYFYGKLYESEEVGFLLLMQSLVLFQYVTNSLWLKNQAVVDNITIAKINLSSTLFCLIFKLTILYTSEVSIISLISIDIFFMVIVCFLTIKVSKEKYSLKFSCRKLDLNYIKLTLKESFPLLLSAASIVLYTKIDQLMIKNILDFNIVAEYSLALKISQAWYFIPLIITSIYFPKLIAKKQDSELSYHNTLAGLYSLMGGISLLIVLFYYFIAPVFIAALFTDEYKSISEVVFFLSLSGVFVSLGYVNGKWVVCERLTSITLYRNLIGLIFNIVLNYLLIPVYGMNGAAFSTLISLFISSNLSFVLFKSTRKMFIFQNKNLFNFRKIIYLIKD